MIQWIDNKSGIITDLIGKCVDVERHPRFPQLYKFKYEGDVYVCSDYAFQKEFVQLDGEIIYNITTVNKRNNKNITDEYNLVNPLLHSNIHVILDQDNQKKKCIIKFMGIEDNIIKFNTVYSYIL